MPKCGLTIKSAINGTLEVRHTRLRTSKITKFTDSVGVYLSICEQIISEGLTANEVQTCFNMACYKQQPVSSV